MPLSLADEKKQITCLYDMDIVFRPDGNFDEVYLYVSGFDRCQRLGR